MSVKLALLAFVLFLTACASNVANPALPPAVARVELVSLSPEVGSQVYEGTVLVATINYTIDHFKPGVDYYIAPQFASNIGPGVTFNKSDRIADSHAITDAHGTVTIKYSIAGELQSAQLVRPIQVWFYLMERIGDAKTRVVGKTQRLDYKTARD